MTSEQQIAGGLIERVGSAGAKHSYWSGGEQRRAFEAPTTDHREAVQSALDFLTDDEFSVLKDLKEIDGVGFKCVQAGEKNGTVLLEEDVLDAMKRFNDLAPAHNPAYIEAIRMFRELLPGTPLVGVFEPGFHASAPEYAKIYGTPFDWFEKYGVRKYGYHGASHRYITAETLRVLDLEGKNHRIISCHLGGSSSLCAFRDGVAMDTSMGFTPQTGLIQGTRIGDLDPFILPYIMEKKGLTLEQALDECSSQAGLAGVSGTSGDMRDILEQIRAGSRRARLARDKFIYDIKRYVGEYIVLMEGLDAITFTGGIGEHDSDLRMRVLSSLGFLGLELDEARNREDCEVITAEGSKITALVLQTNEEIIVARETARLIEEM